MNDLKEMAMDVAASLWIEPATMEDLAKKMDSSEWAIWQLIKSCERRGWIYERGEKYFTYKKVVKDVLNKKGYELDLKEEYKSDFRKEFERLYG